MTSVSTKQDRPTSAPARRGIIQTLVDTVLPRPSMPPAATGEAYFVRLEELQARAKDARSKLAAVTAEVDRFLDGVEALDDGTRERFAELERDRKILARLVDAAEKEIAAHIAIFEAEANAFYHRVLAASNACRALMQKIVRARLEPIFGPRPTGLANREEYDRDVRDAVSKSVYSVEEYARTSAVVTFDSRTHSPAEFMPHIQAWRAMIERSEAWLEILHEIAAGKRPLEEALTMIDKFRDLPRTTKAFLHAYESPEQVAHRKLRAEFDRLVDLVIRFRVAERHPDNIEFDKNGSPRSLGLPSKIFGNPIADFRAFLAQHPEFVEPAKVGLGPHACVLDGLN